MVAGPARGTPTAMPVPARRSTTSWSSPRSTTTSATSGTSGSSTSPGAGTGAASSSASTPPPTARWCGPATSRSCEHEGGYTPFEADLTAVAVAGEPLRVTVVVNNELTWTSIPPGVIHDLGEGKRKQFYYHDFFNYAGLHRSVWLHVTPQVHVADLTVVSDLDGATGVVRYFVDVAGDPPAGDVAVRVVLRDAEGTVVAAGEGGAGEPRVEVRPAVATRGRLPLRARRRADRGERSSTPTSSLSASGAWRPRLGVPDQR